MSTPSRDALLARYARIGTEAPPVAAQLPEAPAVPTAVHRQVVALLDELLGQIAPGASGPYAGILRTFRHLEPMLLRDFAKTSPDQVVAFAHYLGQRMLAVGADAGGAAADQPAESGLDQSQSA